uniref:Thioredoxin domain-containing protein n=1 Tax=Rhabditophanes sp. KR3021 TaxID=114890 RepID=A0AC35UEJ5_9BILA
MLGNSKVIVLLFLIVGTAVSAYQEDIPEDDFESFDEDKTTEEEIDIRAPVSHLSNQHSKDDIVPFMASNLPTVTFEYCVSCGYKNAFDEYSKMIKEKYPNIDIVGKNFDPIAWKGYVAQVAGIAKFAFIFLVMSLTSDVGYDSILQTKYPIYVKIKMDGSDFLNLTKYSHLLSLTEGKDPITMLGLNFPAASAWVTGNKVSSSLMFFMVGNLLESSMMSTGAFEITLGNEKIWSKLESGRVPSPQELFTIIAQQLEISGIKETNSFSKFDFAEK